jgi:hypothetical protein
VGYAWAFGHVPCISNRYMGLIYHYWHAVRGTFSLEYFPDYMIRTVLHIPWQVKPIRLPHSRCEKLVEMLDEQMKAGKYELSTSYYRSGIFLIEKKHGNLRIVHDLQPLNK